jgi:hypothetical protein
MRKLIATLTMANGVRVEGRIKNHKQGLHPAAVSALVKYPTLTCVELAGADFTREGELARLEGLVDKGSVKLRKQLTVCGVCHKGGGHARSCPVHLAEKANRPSIDERLVSDIAGLAGASETEIAEVREEMREAKAELFSDHSGDSEDPQVLEAAPVTG